MNQAQRPLFDWLLILLLAVLLLLAGGRLAPQDEETTYRTTANLIESGRVTITEQHFTLEPQAYPGFLPSTQPRDLLTTWAVPGRDGQLYPQFMPGQAYLNIPLYWIGRLLGGDLSVHAVMLTRFTTALMNPIIVALTGWLIAVFAGRLGHSTQLSIGLGLTYALGSLAFAYASTYFSEPLIALMITLAAYAVFCARDDQARVKCWLLIAGAALALAVYTRERSAIMLPAFFLYVWLTHRRLRFSAWLALFAPIVVVGSIIGLTNWQRFGSPTTFGFSVLQHTTFTTPLVLGAYGLLISPGKGLLLYTPIAWIGLIGLMVMRRQRRAEALLFGLTVIVEIGFFATYEFWTGGWNWGPRYILPVAPLLILAAGEWVHVKPTSLRRAVIIVLCVIGVVLNLPAALVDQSRYLVDFGERDPDHYLERSTMRIGDSPLIRQWSTVFEVASMYARPETWMAAQQAIDTHLQSYRGDNDLESLSTHLMWVDEFFRLNVPDFWFVHLILLGFSPIVVGLIVAALLGVVILAGRHVWLMIR